ncbi:MAG: S-layer homology domain-containing protein [Candidatus Limnocylindria bacterium]
MPVRTPRAIFLVVSLLFAAAALAAAPHSARAAGEKVVIVVGPVGTLTDNYRARGDQIAATATAAGAQVVKVYSPDATWENVLAAVNGANVIVYVGHGNGYPNPYGSTELTDRTNGWGLNRIAGVDGADPTGDGDNWGTNMVYCGEDALLGRSMAGAAQQQYCTGGPITPAPNFVMIYSNACYAPGAGEARPAPDESVAVSRVANYSWPILALGGTYVATDLGSARMVDLVLRNPTTNFGTIFERGNGFEAAALRRFAHPDASGSEVWVQKTDGLGDPDYWYAFAGNPSRTPSGGFVQYTGGPQVGVSFSDIAGSPFAADIQWLAQAGITGGCGGGRFCPDAAVTREQMASFLVRAMGLTAGAGANLFWDDDGSMHEPDIDRLAASAITGGCAAGQFCPGSYVTRAQMASFLTRARGLTAGAGANLFWDDDGSPHQDDIDRLATSGITGGCGAGRYCPDAFVTRAQMAAFLHRAFGK